MPYRRRVAPLVLAMMLVTSCASVGGLSSEDQSEAPAAASAADIEAEVRQVVSEWPEMTEATMTPPEAAHPLDVEGVQQVREASRVFMYYGHVHPGTLEGDVETVITQTEALGFDLRQDLPVERLHAVITRFGGGWVPVGPVRAKGNWEPTVDNDQVIMTDWRGTFAYLLERNGEQRTQLVARRLAITLHSRSGGMESTMGVNGQVSYQFADTCRGHELSAIVPQADAPTESHELLSSPERPDFSGSSPDVKEELEASGCPEATAQPLW